jgi:uncharacterized protein DUF6046
MNLNFQIGAELLKGHSQNLAKGFGLPLVKRAFLNKQQVEDGDKPDGISLMGTPLFGTLFIEKPFYTEFDYNEIDKTYQEIAPNLSDNKAIGDTKGVFIEGAMVEISQSRNIVLTQIAGMDGSVKEFINNGDFSINIKGYFAGTTPNTFPATDVRALYSYLNAPVPLKITNVYLNSYFGITDIVVTNYSFFQQEGVRNIQFFSIECLSDMPFEILEKKG